MRIVLDTNVLVSGIFWTGKPSQLLSLWQEGRIRLVVTPSILNEYRRVAKDIARKAGFEEIDRILHAVELSAAVLEDVPLRQPACRDPDDDKFLAAAVASGAQYLVSGDKDLLALRNFQGIPIVTAGRLLAALG